MMNEFLTVVLNQRDLPEYRTMTLKPGCCKMYKFHMYDCNNTR